MPVPTVVHVYAFATVVQAWVPDKEGYIRWIKLMVAAFAGDTT